MDDMTCERVRDDEIVERYVLGRLTDTDRDAFESHFFGCDACFAEVRTMQAVSRLAPAAADAPPVRRRAPALLSAAAAVVIVGGAAVWIVMREVPATAPATTTFEREPSSPAPAVTEQTWAELARVDPPPYVTLAMRSAAEDRFAAAMEPYTRGEYALAADRLRAIENADSAPPRVPFFLGASELMLGRADAAIAALERVTAARNAYEEHAHLLLAKAWLAKRDVARAQRELAACIALGGAHAREAQTVLERLGQ